jgi:glycosyltransferase involved in cell wall biosynthesis
MKEKSISVFFPVLDEEQIVERLARDILKILQSRFERYEVIIVDDGSTDRTAQIADELAKEFKGFVRVIHHIKSKGYGNALKAGFSTSRFDLVFFTDGDYQFDMTDLHTSLSLIDDHDIVVGYRLDRKDPKYRLFLAKGYNQLVKLLFGLKLKDVDCSFKLFKREVLQKITIESQGYFVDTELMVKAEKLGFRIHEFGVRHLPRSSGVSKVKLKHIFITLSEIVKLWKKLNQRNEDEK